MGLLLGQAGVAEVESHITRLAKFDVRAARESGDKVTRSLPASAQSERRNVKLVRGEWNERVLQELEAFPEVSHDDQVDAFSGAFNAIADGIAAPIVLARAKAQSPWGNRGRGF